MRQTDSLEAEIRRIETMSLCESCERPVDGPLGSLPPRFRSVDLLRRLIAWRLQAEHYGGLDADTKIMLRRSSMPQPPRSHRQVRG